MIIMLWKDFFNGFASKWSESNQGSTTVIGIDSLVDITISNHVFYNDSHVARCT
uniref:Transposase n=1 Tax=Streptococcus suis TaxID=1307 RepID=G8DTY4_STRSU|nr:transposase [Streptococcus suis]